MAKRPNWYRTLRKPIKIGKPRLLTLRTLADVHDFLNHVPPERRHDN
ncbi:MAG: hypothetical protein WBD90_10755 [Xanthobacteraceae bacterium]|jgi:hypothetical protein